jgi:DNA polymerase-4
VTRAKTFDEPIATTRRLADVAFALARTALVDNPREREINLLAISVSKLVDVEAELEPAPMHALDLAADAVRAKFGRDAVGHASVVFREAGHVPDEFRALAEADEGGGG